MLWLQIFLSSRRINKPLMSSTRRVLQEYEAS